MEEKNPPSCRWSGNPETRTAQRVMKTEQRNHRHSSPVPGRRSRENHHFTRQAHPDVHGSIMYKSHDMDEASVGKDRRMGKRDGAHTHRAMLLSHKKGDITPCPATRKEVETSHQVK